MPALDDLLHDPEFFLTRIVAPTRGIEFLKSTRDTLEHASFLDGRTELSVDGRTYRARFDEINEVRRRHAASDRPPSRFIFHVSFCGSTLLARACTIRGRSFCYKEPQALIDLSSIKASNDGLYRNPTDWSQLVETVLYKFNVPWQPGEKTVIKPSNWINSMLPDLLMSDGSRAVFLTAEPEDFLIAVLRGGRERIRYIGDLLIHLQRAFPAYAEVIKEAAPMNADALESAARLTLVALKVQLAAFAAAREALPADRCAFVSHRSLRDAPADALETASRVLDLELSADDIAYSVRTNISRHAKETGLAFEHEQAREIDRVVARQYRPLIAKALDWYLRRVP